MKVHGNDNLLMQLAPIHTCGILREATTAMPSTTAAGCVSRTIMFIPHPHTGGTRRARLDTQALLSQPSAHTNLRIRWPAGARALASDFVGRSADLQARAGLRGPVRSTAATLSDRSLPPAAAMDER